MPIAAGAPAGSARLPIVTDRLEEQLILELVGLREQAGASLTLVAVMVRSLRRWRALGALVTRIDRDNLVPALCGSCSSVSAMLCLARPAHGHWSAFIAIAGRKPPPAKT